MTWYEALADCYSKGMNLASVESEEEYNKTLSLIKTVGKFVPETAGNIVLVYSICLYQR